MIEAKNAELEQAYTQIVEPIAHAGYQRLCNEWNMPENPLTVELLAVETEKELLELQMKLPEQWCNWPYICHCWATGDMFYILETEASVSMGMKSESFLSDTEYKVTEQLKQIKRFAIELNDIHYFKQKGELIRSQRTIVGGEAAYTGATVNGIGFGEVNYRPPLTVPDMKDSRYIVLYYHQQGVAELQTLYFGYDTWDMLVRIIPQFEK